MDSAVLWAVGDVQTPAWAVCECSWRKNTTQGSRAQGNRASLRAWWAMVPVWALNAPVMLFSSQSFFHILWHQRQ